MKIERWFQGVATCSGERREGNICEEGPYLATCLLMALPFLGGAEERIVQIIERHFSHRACQCPGIGPALRIVHANNHPDTTREDIDKILRIFNEEKDAQRSA